MGVREAKSAGTGNLLHISMNTIKMTLTFLALCLGTQQTQ